MKLQALFSSYVKAGQEVPAWILETYCRHLAITTAAVAPAAASSVSSLSFVSSFIYYIDVVRILGLRVLGRPKLILVEALVGDTRTTPKVLL